MPIYEYACGACRRKTEVIQGMKDKPLKVCPHCGARRLKKLLSAPAIQFKGSGFYITDYASGDRKSVKKAEGEKSEAAGKPDKPAKPESAGKSEKVEKKAEKKEKKA